MLSATRGAVFRVIRSRMRTHAIRFFLEGRTFSSFIHLFSKMSKKQESQPPEFNLQRARELAESWNGEFMRYPN